MMTLGARGLLAAAALILLHAGIAQGQGIAQSRECRSISFPSQTQFDAGTLQLNGLGLRQATVFRVNVYVAALYVATPSADPTVILASNTPKRLILHFVRDVGAGNIRDSWEDGFAKTAKAQLPALKARIETLNSWMPDIRSGQQMVFDFRPGTGVQVTVKGSAKGTIEGDDFARALLSIWLGADPPNRELKAGLLGGACG